MAKKEKPLPIPPKTSSGGKRRFEDDTEKGPLLADEIAMAMARGKMDEFMKQELPDNEHVRKLVGMMMGLTGMMPTGAGEKDGKDDPDRPVQGKKAGVLPEDLMKAVMSADTHNVMELLKQEHEKRNPDLQEKPEKKESPTSPGDLSRREKEVINTLTNIAKENGVTIDWLVMRALTVYIREYQKTGKL